MVQVHNGDILGSERSRCCALSHSNVLLKAGCASEDHEFLFGGYQDPVSGQSTSEDHPDELYTANWFGYLSLEGDPPTGVSGPLIKYEQPVLDQYGDPIPPAEDPGADGHGTFWYYCNVIPQNGSDGDGQEPWENVLVAKGGDDNNSLGRFNGRCPVLPNHSRAGDAGAGAVRRFGPAKAEGKTDKVCFALVDQLDFRQRGLSQSL